MYDNNNEIITKNLPRIIPKDDAWVFQCKDECGFETAEMAIHTAADICEHHLANECELREGYEPEQDTYIVITQTNLQEAMTKYLKDSGQDRRPLDPNVLNRINNV